MREKAFQVAVDLIKAYVLRGDSYSDIKRGQLGSSCSEQSACIGGYVSGRKVSSDCILVSRVEGISCVQVFKLRDIIDYIKTDRNQIKMF